MLVFEQNRILPHQTHGMKVFIWICFWFVGSVVFSQNPIKPPHDSTFVNLAAHSADFVLDLRYATTQNFMQTKVYDCAKCFLRYKTVKALIAANLEFQKRGYKIKLYDCYRPTAVQKLMFDLVPNPTYVADPQKGSIHNRGAAVDLTLIDSNGNELDMGTAFDFFGEEAAHTYQKLSSEVLSNRVLLKTVLEKNGFSAIQSEWWHYNLKQESPDKLSNFKWDCD